MKIIEDTSIYYAKNPPKPTFIDEYNEPGFLLNIFPLNDNPLSRNEITKLVKKGFIFTLKIQEKTDNQKKIQEIYELGINKKRFKDSIVNFERNEITHIKVHNRITHIRDPKLSNLEENEYEQICNRIATNPKNPTTIKFFKLFK